MREKLALLLLFISASSAFGQHHIFQSVHVSLPSPECYRILQDNRGFVWIATEQGLCRFDGQNTKIYGPQEGMPEKEVYALKKEKNGLIWLLTRKGRILHIRDNKVVDAGFKKQFGDPTMSNIGYDFFFQKQRVFIPVGSGTAIRLNRKDKSFVKVENKQPNHSFIDIEHREGQVVPLVMFSPGPKLLGNIKIRYTDKDNPARSRTFTMQIDNSYSPQVITTKLKDRVFIGFCSRVVEIGTHGELKIHHVPNRILSISPDSRGGLWVGILGYGVRYYAHGDLSRQPVQSLPGLSVSNIMEDNEHHIWCTTLEKGVYICRQPAMLAFDNFYGLHRPPNVLTADQGELLISSKQNEVIVIDALLQVERLTLTGRYGESVSSIKKIGNQWIVGYGEMLTSGTRKRDKLMLRQHTEDLSLQGVQLGDWHGLTYVLSCRQIHSYVEGKAKAVTGLFSFKARSFLVLSPEKFLVSIHNELRCVHVKNGKTSYRILSRSPVTISRLFLTKSKRVFILTKGEGLFELCKERVVNRNKSMQIPTKVLNDVVEDSCGNLWIASNEGLLKLSLKGNGYGKPQMFDERHGFPSRVCDKLAVIGKTLAVSTTEGLITFPLEAHLQSEVKPGLNFHQVVVNGQPIHVSNAALRHYENSLLLHFSVPSYHQDRGQLLRFSLDNGSHIQNGVSGPVLSLKNLDPGNYRLTISGQNIFGLKSSCPIIINFTILPPFWLTWWFISCCLFLIIAGLLYLFWWTRQRIERRNHLKLQLVKSQLSTLQAQMNPHFLFNSISSIQNFIMSNKREEAYDYLTAFSKLIRRTLNNSRSQFISLTEEIETLRLYMELEQRRYNYTFDFHLELSPEIVSGNILLPPSLIQPLLENAIGHGVAGIHAERRGQISLCITAAGPLYLRVTVIDNGVGIQQPTHATHQSLAITLIEEQLLLLSGSLKKNREPLVALRTAENGQGTAVSFNLPILNRHENIISGR